MLNFQLQLCNFFFQVFFCEGYTLKLYNYTILVTYILFCKVIFLQPLSMNYDGFSEKKIYLQLRYSAVILRLPSKDDQSCKYMGKQYRGCLQKNMYVELLKYEVLARFVGPPIVLMNMPWLQIFFFRNFVYKIIAISFHNACEHASNTYGPFTSVNNL